MTRPAAVLDPSFLAGQRARLLALRAELSQTLQRGAEEERQGLLASQGQANEDEDGAQDLALSENDLNLVEQLARQRSAIDRALATLDEGTYGFSDFSRLPIPTARLQAFPQALLTLEEESASELSSQGIHKVPGRA